MSTADKTQEETRQEEICLL